jgi:polar amino acid transport system substrate-binding protein
VRPLSQSEPLDTPYKGASLFSSCLLALWLNHSAAADPMEYIFFEFKPRMYLENNQVRGPVAEKAMQVFQTAGFQIEVVTEIPNKRILAMLQEPKPHRCSAGWFKTIERLPLYKFSLPLMIDPRHFVVTTKDKYSHISRHSDFTSLLQDTRLSTGYPIGLSLGQKLDTIIKSQATHVYPVQSYSQMVRMLASGRIDFLVSDPDEFKAELEQGAINQEEFVYINFIDIPESEKRYIICTRSTPDAVMDRINEAIKQHP